MLSSNFGVCTTRMFDISVERTCLQTSPQQLWLQKRKKTKRKQTRIAIQENLGSFAGDGTTIKHCKTSNISQMIFSDSLFVITEQNLPYQNVFFFKLGECYLVMSVEEVPNRNKIFELSFVCHGKNTTTNCGLGRERTSMCFFLHRVQETVSGHTHTLFFRDLLRHLKEDNSHKAMQHSMHLRQRLFSPPQSITQKGVRTHLSSAWECERGFLQHLSPF